jgi:hypothetical protein
MQRACGRREAHAPRHLGEGAQLAQGDVSQRIPYGKANKS